MLAERAKCANRPRTTSYCRALGLVWIALAFVYTYLVLAQWPGLLNTTSIARLEVFGGAGLLLSGAWSLPRLWRATREATATPAGRVAVAYRCFALLASIVLCTLYLTLILNARDLIAIASGHDRYAGAELRLLSDTEAEVRGSLGVGIAARLERLLHEHSAVRVLHLNSIGGWVSEGQFLAAVIHSHGLATYTATGCYSACIIAFEAGVPRTIYSGARLGFHSTTGAGTDPVYVSFTNDSVAIRFRKAGASEEFITRAFATPSSSMWFPDNATLLANHLADVETYGAGFSHSGEDLSDYSVQVIKAESRAPFVRALIAIDPDYQARLERTLALQLRRNAGASEQTALFVRYANLAERLELSQASDQAVTNYASTLYQVAHAYRTDDPRQCLAVLGPDNTSFNQRSAEATQMLFGALTGLLLQARAVPALSRVAYAGEFSHVLARAQAESSIDLPASLDDQASPPRRCQAWLRLFEFALASDERTSSNFLRTLRSP